MDPVLVVGAGPVGLTAAAFLAHAGTPVRIIDANAAPTTLSKALVLWRRSLLTLAPLIPPAYWHSVGEPVLAACFADNGELAAQLQVPAPPGYTQQPHLNAAAAAAAPSASEASDAGDAAAGKDGQAAAAVPEQQQCGSVHALPAGMLVVQADIEGALVTLLRDSYGIEVQRNTSLAAFSVAEDSSSVLCTLTDTDGSNQQQLRASYLVGCDGGRSAVRKLLGVQFAGTTLDQRWLLGDFRYEVDAAVNAAHTPQHPCEGSLQRGTLFISPTDVGLMGLIPLGKRQGQVRVIWNADAHCPGEPTMQDFQQLLSTHTRQQMRLTEALWLSEFKINERQVQSYLHGNGRVLLAGDAAHIHSPAGGLGMNTGLQDAANLAWKLSLVAAGEAAAGWQLLDTYQEERHPVGAHVIRMSGLLLRANALRNPFVRFVRKWALRTLAAVPAVANRMTSAMTGDDICYSHCSLAAAATVAAGGAAVRTRQAATAAERQVWGCCKPGAAFPDVSIQVGGVEQPAAVLLLSKPGCFGTLVLMPAAQQQQQQQLQQQADAAEGGARPKAGQQHAAWPSSWGHWPLDVVHVSDAAASAAGGAESDAAAGAAGGADVAVDAWGLLVAAVAGRAGVGVLVRPDGIVAAVGGPDEVNGWLAKHVVTSRDAAA